MTNGSSMSRDPNDYTLTNHARDQVKDREIPVHSIKKAIREGDIDDEFARENHQTSFILDSPGVRLIVIVDKTNNNIVTVYYDDEEGAEGGSLGGRKFGSIMERIRDG